jgi:hypothetical protein
VLGFTDLMIGVHEAAHLRLVAQMPDPGLSVGGQVKDWHELHNGPFDWTGGQRLPLAGSASIGLQASDERRKANFKVTGTNGLAL